MIVGFDGIQNIHIVHSHLTLTLILTLTLKGDKVNP